MKEINEKKQLRSTKIEEMNTILETAKNENRVKSPEELSRWNTLSQEVEEIDNEIKVLERQNELNKSITIINNTKNMSEEQKVVERYSFAKHLKQYMRGAQYDGAEAEIQSMGEEEYRRAGQNPSGLILPSHFFKRASVTTSTNASEISEIVDPNIQYAVAPSLIERLGVRVLDGVSSKLKLNYSKGESASFVSEGNSLSESSRTKATEEISARRVGGWKNFSLEYLSESAVFPQILADFNRSIDRAVTKELLDVILADSSIVKSGFASTDTAAAMTWSGITSLGADLETESFVSPRYVMTKAAYHKLAATPKDAGSGLFIVDPNGSIFGDPAFGTTLMGYSDTGSTKAQIIYGDFNAATVAYYSGVQLILAQDATALKSGEIVLIFHRLADVGHNPYMFKTAKNVSA